MKKSSINNSEITNFGDLRAEDIIDQYFFKTEVVWKLQVKGYAYKPATTDRF